LTAHTETALLIDVATSALHPEKGVILETAVALLDLTTLEVLDVHSGPVKNERAACQGALPALAPLVEECCTSPDAVTVRGREGFLLAGQWTTAGILVDHDAGFTRKWLEKHMPTMAKALPKRVLDLHALRRMMAARGLSEFVSSVPKTYRAPDDIVATVEELVHLLTFGGRVS
jgi:oligoribonuclease (3'-5' exoribonuclease)